MKQIKYETNSGVDDCVFEVEDDQVEDCIAAEMETAKAWFKRDGIRFFIEEFVNDEGYLYTEIWENGGDRYVRWIRL